MAKQIRDNQFAIRFSKTLRAALEDEAAADGRNLSSLIRKILVDHAAQRVVDRGQITA